VISSIGLLLKKHQLTEYKMAKKEQSANAAIADLANRTARSSIAVIDTVSSRGGFRGEELSTIGQLRDQCVQIVAMCEAEQQSAADTSDS